MNSNHDQNQYDENIKDLVLARLETLPEGAMISIGGGQELSKKDMLESIKRGDEVGKKFIEIELTFLQGLKEGVLYGSTSTSN